MTRYDLDGPPPPPPSRKPRPVQSCMPGKHWWAWFRFDFDGKDVYRCKKCGKVKKI